MQVEVVARGDSAVAELPFDPKQEFGRVRAPVRVTANGYTFCTTTMRYGGVDLIGFNREVRDRTRLRLGDVVTLRIELDREERVVSVPGDLAAGLRSAPDAARIFEKLSYTHRREYARWVAEAKRDETRRRRVEKTIEMLRSGVKHP